jgi:cob(I)alamin adenosyltransferase
MRKVVKSVIAVVIPNVEIFLRIMIYTKGGDKGETGLFNGKRVSKSDQIIEVLGEIDELNAFIGLVKVKIKDKTEKEFLTEIQKDLYQIMSIVAGGKKESDFLKDRVFQFEKTIDRIENSLPRLNRFIIPGGSELSALYQILRTVCRRVEREIIKLGRDQISDIIPYINRLSDLFFILSRKESDQETVKI